MNPQEETLLVNEIEEQKIKVDKIKDSRLPLIDFNHIPFGKIFSDHMVVIDYNHGSWSDIEIMPYQKFEFAPGLITLHYGQAIFEGLKAFRNSQDQVVLFRPDENIKRFNISAKRMCMPVLPEGLFFKALNALISLDRAWIPNQNEGSLYIRPFMFGTDEFIGVHSSESYRFCIFTCPSGPYFTKPIATKIETKYARATQGGIGYAKAAANYAAALYPTEIAFSENFDQVIWTDSKEHRYIEEAGTMNVFFRIGDTLVTPPVGETILDGITRKSVIVLAKELGIQTEERPVSTQELKEAYDKGLLLEAFGTGTAATLFPIAQIGLKEERWNLALPSSTSSYASLLKKAMEDIRFGISNDTHDWMHKIKTPIPGE